MNTIMAIWFFLMLSTIPLQVKAASDAARPKRPQARL
jgi:hypothetical protein